MEPACTTIEEFIKARLDALLAFPEYWGGAEAFELQALLLLELRQFLRAPLPERESLRTQTDLYSSFLRAGHPGVGSGPLSAAGHDAGTIASCIQRFRAIASASHSSTPTPPPIAPLALGVDVVVSPQTPTMPRTSDEPASI